MGQINFIISNIYIWKHGTAETVKKFRRKQNAS